MAAIPAMIFVPGQTTLLTRVPLDQLFSPKASIQRDFRYIRYSEYPTHVLKTEQPPVQLQPLGLSSQPSSVPLAQVTLV